MLSWSRAAELFDVDSYNENYSAAAPIPMTFDFTEDLAEMELLRLAVSA